MLVFLCKYANFIDYSNKKESVNVILIITIIVLNVLVLEMILVLSIQVKKKKNWKEKGILYVLFADTVVNSRSN